MNGTTNLILALIAGGLLGSIFFGGLWWTVNRGISSEWPAVWFLCSLCYERLLPLQASILSRMAMAEGWWLAWLDFSQRAFSLPGSLACESKREISLSKEVAREPHFRPAHFWQHGFFKLNETNRRHLGVDDRDGVGREADHPKACD